MSDFVWRPMKACSDVGADLQEQSPVLAAVDPLGRLYELLGGVHRAAASQQLSIQDLKPALLVQVEPSRPLVVALRQRLENLVVVLLQVLLLTAEVLLGTHDVCVNV